MPLDILGPASDKAITTRPPRVIARGPNNTWFIDCTSPTADDGTVLPADFLNDVLAQFRTAFDAANISEDNADDMLWRAMQSAGIRYAVDTGAANALVGQFKPTVKAWAPGMWVAIKVAQSSIASPNGVTLAADGLPPARIIRTSGVDPSANDLLAGGIALLCYDGAKLQLMAVQASSGGGGVGGASRYNVPFCVAQGTAAAITCAYTPAYTNPTAGDLISFRIPWDIGGATTVKPDGLGPYQLRTVNNQQLPNGFATNGDTLLCEFDGAVMIVLSKGSVPGPKGDTGAQGPQGPQGPQGVQGPPGPLLYSPGIGSYALVFSVNKFNLYGYYSNIVPNRGGVGDSNLGLAFPNGPISWSQTGPYQPTDPSCMSFLPGSWAPVSYAGVIGTYSDGTTPSPNPGGVLLVQRVG